MITIEESVRKIYYSMLNRCNNPENPAYKNYGGRGIKVCERWSGKKIGLMNFKADVSPRPSFLHSLDRIDNNKGYSPDNCKWSTKIEQGNNIRKNVYYEFNGIKLCREQWARKLNISGVALTNRVKNWPLERALTEPKELNSLRNRKLENKLCLHCNVSYYPTFRNRKFCTFKCGALHRKGVPLK